MKLNIFTRTDAETTKRTIRIFREEIQSEKKYLLLASIFVPAQNFLYTVLLPLFISFFTQALVTDSHDIKKPLWLLGGMAVTSLLAIGTGHIGFIALFNHEERMTTRLTERALKGLFAHSYSFFANSKVGSLAGDVNTFSRSYLALLDTFFLQANSIIVNFVASLIIIAFIAPIMLPPLILLTLVILYDALRSYSRRSTYRNKRKNLMSKLFGNIADALGNQALVRMFGRAQIETAELVRQRKDIESIAEKEINIIQRSAETRMSILFVFQIATLGLCLFLISHSMLSIAALIFIVTYLGRVTGSIFAISGIIRTAEQAFLDAAKVTEMLQLSPEIVDIPNAKRLEANTGSIAFRNVSFSYQDAQGKSVFKNLNLVIPSGQSIGLVGRSGGGKSTLTHLLLRYMNINGGEILIDEQDIAKVTQDSLRSAIAFVPQDPFLFHRSLRENIAYGKLGATDKEILSATKRANAFEFISDLPNSLDTIVGERGVKLSGGQRQRIAIARAILKDAPILVLDEATSALDSESEKLIQASLSELMKNRTSIVIAHRLSTIAKLDRIIVLDKGAIVEDGSHKELLEKAGIYANLWKHQSGGFIEE
jgi:ATP-binding cassette subfamily B protein